MIYFQKHFLTIRHDEEQNILFAEWQGHVSSEEFREGMRKIMEVILDQHIPMWFSNSRNMNPLSLMDQRWTNQFFVSALVNSPLKKVARLLSDEIIHQLVINNMIEHAVETNTLTVEINQFTDYESAMKWLLTDVTVR